MLRIVSAPVHDTWRSPQDVGGLKENEKACADTTPRRRLRACIKETETTKRAKGQRALATVARP
jgi:hypothetical protein